ncbi:hypothetical protein I2I11_15800 [Pontibacter sp. 172403-2]|uniref:hypothetical protein n=1 Tax=Pontibacter rufus TaxID=2791028 RepID=UPI0018AF9502|nr:hypothetical protein [Pontibacter sp. 172403-2]MBF9254769.1 hypothetical protein [Pontibacter sp. 172403-2]
MKKLVSGIMIQKPPFIFDSYAANGACVGKSRRAGKPLEIYCKLITFASFGK